MYDTYDPKSVLYPRTLEPLDWILLFHYSVLHGPTHSPATFQNLTPRFFLLFKTFFDTWPLLLFPLFLMPPVAFKFVGADDEGNSLSTAMDVNASAAAVAAPAGTVLLPRKGVVSSSISAIQTFHHIQNRCLLVEKFHKMCNNCTWVYWRLKCGRFTDQVTQTGFVLAPA